MVNCFNLLFFREAIRFLGCFFFFYLKFVIRNDKFALEADENITILCFVWINPDIDFEVSINPNIATRIQNILQNQSSA